MSITEEGTKSEESEELLSAAPKKILNA